MPPSPSGVVKVERRERDDQQTVPLGGRDPGLAVFGTIAAHAVLYDDDRLVGVVSVRPEAFQHQRPVGAVAVEVRDAGATGLRQRSRKVVWAHRRLPRGNGNPIQCRVSINTAIEPIVGLLGDLRESSDILP